MRKITIQQKLEELGVDIESIPMGDFDLIGKFTAERQRGPNDPGYKKWGAFYRSNYERGILLYHLITRHRMSSMLEIGFGRGYSAVCAAKAFHDIGVRGKILTIDPVLDEKHLEMVQQIFPKEWLNCITFVKGKSIDCLPKINEEFDLVYIDGDHSYEATLSDWEMTKSKWKKCIVFDDYHLPQKVDPGIQCREVIDSIEDSSKELIIMDRRMFFDDRRLSDDQIDYGQVLMTRPEVP